MLSPTKSSLEIEVTHLNGIIFEERKKSEDQEKELDGTPTKAHCKLSKAEDQLGIIAQESVKAYKASEDCTEDKREYALVSYLYGRDEVQSKVLLKFSQLWLDFLDEMSDEYDASKDTASPSDD